MTRLPDIALDPYLLCLPTPCESAVQIEDFVERLLAWKKAIKLRDLRILISEDCINALYGDGQYPYRHQLNRLMQEFPIEFADTETIAQVAQGLLDRLPPLDEVTGIAYALCCDGYPIIVPDALLVRLGPRTQVAFADALVRLAYHYGIEENGRDCIIASSVLSTDGPEVHEVVVRALIEDIEVTSSGNHTEHVTPVLAERVFSRHLNYESILRVAGPIQLWGEGTSTASAIEAVHVAVNKLAGVDYSLMQARKVACFGSSFLASVQKNSFTSRHDWLGVLIESCARIIVGEPKNDVRPFRRNESPDAEQRTRSYDDARAFRTHLTGGHEGWRLMLWKWPDGTIEFANVGRKFELEIEEGEDGQHSEPI